MCQKRLAAGHCPRSVGRAEFKGYGTDKGSGKDRRDVTGEGGDMRRSGRTGGGGGQRGEEGREISPHGLF